MSRIKVTPQTYNGLKVRVTKDVKDVVNTLDQRVIKAGTVGTVTYYNKLMGRYRVNFGDISLSVKISDTEIAY